ncbi:hypothetical protein D3C73_1169270 [compost metagenome]
MQLLECPRKRVRRRIAVLQGDVDHLRVALPQLCRGARQPSAPDVLGQRNARQEREHPGEVILRAKRDPRRLGHVDVVREPRFDVCQRGVHVLQRIHICFRPPLVNRITGSAKTYPTFIAPLCRAGLVSPGFGTSGSGGRRERERLGWYKVGLRSESFI